MEEKLNIDEMTYEQAINELELIISQMDKGNIPLDESMNKFELGVRLISKCESILDGYEKRITKITKTGINGYKEEEY